jgi:hypothetical protein
MNLSSGLQVLNNLHGQRVPLICLIPGRLTKRSGSKGSKGKGGKGGKGEMFEANCRCREASILQIKIQRQSEVQYKTRHHNQNHYKILQS